MKTAALEVSNLCLRYGDKTVLDGVSFRVEQGESFAIIGPNGAGKTTLLRSLGRMTAGSGRGVRVSGEIRVFGKLLSGYTQRELARRISYVPQAGGRLFPFTVNDFVLMARYPHMSPLSHLSQADRDAAVRAMARTGTAVFSERRMNTLSGGERQKVFIAAALAQEADILLLDEPTTFLDYKHQTEVLELVHELQLQQGLTVASVTHDLNHGALGSSHVLALKGGKVAFDGTPKGLIDHAVLEQIYETPFDFLTHPETGDIIVVTARGAV